MKQDELKRMAEMDVVFEALRKEGVNEKTSADHVGLGDVVESTLKRFGITEERYKDWFNLKKCNCDARKKFLNRLKLWRKSDD